MTNYFNPITGFQLNVPYDSLLELNLTAPITLSWPTIQQNTVYPVALNIIVETTTSTSNTITFPNATQASLNYSTSVTNQTAGNISLLRNDGSALATIAAGQTLDVLLTDNTTAAGTWLTSVRGAGTSAADAAVLAGYGLKAITTTLNSNYLAPVVSTNFTVQLTDRASIKEWSGGAGAVALQAGSVYEAGFWFCFKILPTGGQVIFTPASGTINGSASYTLAPGNSAFFVVDNNNNWITFGDGIPTYTTISVLNKDILPGTTSFNLTSLEQSYIVQNYTSNSGNLTAACTITYNNSIPGYYLINNLTTGGQNLIITDGTNNYTVSPNAAIFLKNDGTRIYSAVSEIQNLQILNNLVCLDTLNQQVGFKAATSNAIANQVYTLPTNFPSANNNLFASSTAGNMSFVDANVNALWAVRSSNQTVTTTGTTTLIFDSIQFESAAGSYNNVSGIYTVPTVGFYQFVANLMFNVGVGSAGVLTATIETGAPTKITMITEVAATDNFANIVLSGILNLSAATTVTITITVTSGTFLSIQLRSGAGLNICKYAGL